MRLERGVGGGFEKREDFFGLALDVPLSCLEILTNEFVGKTQKGLVLDLEHQRVA